jgi:hypothetical protein
MGTRDWGLGDEWGLEDGHSGLGTGDLGVNGD